MLFEPISISQLSIPNRFVRSATHEWLALDDGTPTPQIGDIYEVLAKGGVGLIITGYSYVNPQGKSSAKQQGIYDDRFIVAYRGIVKRVHAHGAKIVAQIVHGGRQSLVSEDNPVALAPSAVIDTSSGITPREMTESEILATIEDFAQAALRVKKAGFDGVQLHCAHGFLLSEFISPHTNRRGDRWGGSVENRTRIIVEIIRRIHELVGGIGVDGENCGKGKEGSGDEEFPILVKLNAMDGLDGGLDAPDSVEIARILADNGVCAIEVSGGIMEAGPVMSRSGINSADKEAYFKEYAKMIRDAVDIPIILVGGIRTRGVMESLIEGGYADMIAMSRTLIREPDLVAKLESGEVDGASCVSCNKCFDPRGIRCNYEG